MTYQLINLYFGKKVLRRYSFFRIDGFKGDNLIIKEGKSFPGLMYSFAD
jgi:hypothetical protein